MTDFKMSPPSDAPPEPPQSEEEPDWFNWFFALLGVAVGILILSSFVSEQAAFWFLLLFLIMPVSILSILFSLVLSQFTRNNQRMKTVCAFAAFLLPILFVAVGLWIYFLPWSDWLNEWLPQPRGR